MRNAFLLVLTLFAVARTATPPNTSREETWVTNGTVHAILPAGDRIYIGGDFTHVGPYTGRGVPISAATGAAQAAFPKVNGTISAVCPDGSGGWYIGGDFSAVDGVTRNKIAHILSSGAVNLSWNPDADSAVLSIVLSGNTLYVGGRFAFIGGQARNRIAALEAITGNVTGWNPDANASVSALAVNGTTVYAGGSFTTIGTQNRSRIAALDATTGNATDWDPDAGGLVYAITVSGATVYAGGVFTSIGGQTRNRIAALDAATGNATDWNPNSGGTVYAIAVSGATVYTAGVFTTIGGQTRNRIAALDAATGNATGWNPNADNVIRALAISGTTVYAGGQFASIGGQTRNCIAALDAATGNATDWNPNVSGVVSALAAHDGTVYAGGGFTSIGGQNRNRIAALDTATGNAVDWNPNANNSVRAIAIREGTVYAGGEFTSIGGQNRNRIAALNATTGNATAWNPNAGSRVNALAITPPDINGTTVYAGGQFTSIGGQSRNRIAALDAATGNATAWNPDANGNVNALALSVFHTVYVGGQFTSIGGQNRNRIAALSSITGNATNWNPDANHIISALAVDRATVYAGGQFSSIGGEDRNRIAALDTTTGNATGWRPDANGNVFALNVQADAVYVAGSFTAIGGQPRNRMASIDIVSGLATAWNPILSGVDNTVVYALAVSGTTVYVGGMGTMGSDGRWSFAQYGELFPAPAVTSATPDAGIQNTLVTFDIQGSGFRDGASVTLIHAQQSTLTATGVVVVTNNLITCSVDLGDAAAGVWDIIVRNHDTKSDTLAAAFTVRSAPPVLLAPPDNAPEAGLTPTLVWRRLADDSLYTLHVSALLNFEPNLIDDDLISDTAFTIPSGLLASTTSYYWKVAITKKGGEVTDFCEPWVFATTPDIPPAVELKTPAMGDTVHADSVWLVWGATESGAESYRVEYAGDSLFTASIVDSNVTDVMMLVRGLQDDSTVWWRVQARNATGWGPWSEAAYFLVRLPVHANRVRPPAAFSFGVTGRRGTVRYALPRAANVSMRVFTANGQMIAHIVRAYQPAGVYTVNLPSAVAASGTCLVVFETPGYTRTQLLVLTR